MNKIDINKLIIGIKSAGEMATGVAFRLYKSNIKKIFMMEIENPLAVRRKVSFSEAIHNDKTIVENIKAVKVSHINEINHAWNEKNIPIIVDPHWKSIKKIQPHVVIDAIIAKQNLGTTLNEASLVIGLGPGFTAQQDVHMIIETNRGHNLGQIILSGSAQPNTSIPGTINGFNKQRVLRAPCAGYFNSKLKIGTIVKIGQAIGNVNEKNVNTKINGILRGMIKIGTYVKKGMKIGDVDPRKEISYCNTISDKSRAVAGGVLEAILRKYNN
ncbi:MAG: molybdenum hydroxylase [Desulfobacteraceae bacterium 4572_130]|nr:MAG: molybdenum hydroxylase [Desulfobacteraceae bacterium 4572_130]